MSNLFTIDQIAELRSIEKARIRNGRPGLGAEVAELIRCLTSGGLPAVKTEDVRIRQAVRFWDIGVGYLKLSQRECFSTFEAYLATIPHVPAELLQQDEDFPLLVLVEPRVGLRRLCELGEIEFSGDDNTLVAYDERHREFVGPTWIRVQDGRKNRGCAVRDCRTSFAQDEIGLTALQGVCTYLQHPQSVADADREDGHVMDLSGSVRRAHRDLAAFLKAWKSRAKLHWHFHGYAYPKYGSASRRERKAL